MDGAALAGSGVGGGPELVLVRRLAANLHRERAARHALILYVYKVGAAAASGGPGSASLMWLCMHLNAWGVEAVCRGSHVLLQAVAALRRRPPPRSAPRRAPAPCRPTPAVPHPANSERNALTSLPPSLCLPLPPPPPTHTPSTAAVPVAVAVPHAAARHPCTPGLPPFGHAPERDVFAAADGASIRCGTPAHAGHPGHGRGLVRAPRRGLTMSLLGADMALPTGCDRLTD